MDADDAGQTELAEQEAPQNLRKVCTELAEEFRYSDPVSTAALHDLEVRISALVSELRQSIQDGNPEYAQTLCDKTSALLRERNAKCKLVKR